MFRSISRPHIIKGFCHTNNKTIFQENNQKCFELLQEQNRRLQKNK